jgi:hypothetical protein
MGKSTFLKVLTGINFKTGDCGKRTTNGILYGTSNKDDIDICTFDTEGFDSHYVQHKIF